MGSIKRTFTLYNVAVTDKDGVEVTQACGSKKDAAKLQATLKHFGLESEVKEEKKTIEL